MSYIVVQDWMVKDLNLKGNDLLVYAVIYGFSQDGESKFTGSLQYLADWCGSTKRGIQKNLQNLLDAGLITKEETYRNNIKFCAYSSIPVNIVLYPIEHSSINNIEDTIDKNKLSKDNYRRTLIDDDTVVSTAEKPKRKSRYEQCIDAIYEYTDDPLLQESLRQYLPVRMDVKEKPLHGVNQWKGLLKRLNDFPASQRVAIVQQSIEKGWCSFYEVKQISGRVVQRKDVFSEYGAVHSVKVTDDGGDHYF